MTRNLEVADWAGLWPLLLGMGVLDEEVVVRQRFEDLVRDDRWELVAAVAGRRLVGYAAAQDFGPHLRAGDHHRTARLHDLYVDPSYRGHGHGRALMAAMEAWARGRVRHFEWQAHERDAAPFYEHLGYVGNPCPQPEHPTFEVTYDRP